MDLTRSGVIELTPVCNLRTFDEESYLLSSFIVGPWKPFMLMSGVIKVLTLSMFPTLRWASWRTPNNSRPTILQGTADKAMIP